MVRILVLFLILSTSCFAQSQRQLNYMQESFDGPGIPAGWTVHLIVGPIATWSVVGSGTNPPIAPYGPPGQAKFNSYDAWPGKQARLISPPVDLAGAVDPFFEFFFYYDDQFPEALDSIYIEATTADSIVGPWATLGGFRRFSTPPRWEKIALSLLNFAGNDRMFLSIRGVSQYGNNMYIDEVRVADSAFHDLSSAGFVTSEHQNIQQAAGTESSRFLESPAAPNNTSIFLAGAVETTDVCVVIENVGTFDEPFYGIYWALDGKINGLINVNDTLRRGSTDTIALPLEHLPAGEYSLAAWVEVPGDENQINDTIRTTLYLDPSIFFFEGFDNIIFPPIGWLVMNRDGGPLPPWFWGPTSAAFPPFQGAGFAADNFQRANGTYLDDYLISSIMNGLPGSGTEDSLVFWTRSPFNPPPFTNYPDSLMVLLSATGQDTSAFDVVLDYFAVPKGAWSRKAYRLTGIMPNNSNLAVAFRYLHYAGGTNGPNSDLVGIDGFHVKRSPPLAVKEDDPIASEFHLEQNFPNPFNPQTSIAFSVPRKEQISLNVFNVLGEVVRSLAEGEYDAGRHVVQFDAEGISSGMYFYRLTTAEGSITKSMLFIR